MQEMVRTPYYGNIKISFPFSSDLKHRSSFIDGNICSGALLDVYKLEDQDFCFLCAHCHYYYYGRVRED